MTVWDSMALNATHTEREIRSIHETGAGDLPTKLDGFPLLEEAIKEHFGQRCDEYMAGCPCCDTWAELDRLRAIRAATARELAQDGEPAHGSTTEPENATSPSAGLSGALAVGDESCHAANDHTADERYGRLMNENLFLQIQLDAYREMAEAKRPIDLKGRMQEVRAAKQRRAEERKAYIAEVLAIVTAEKANWPHAGAMHDGARMACDAIAERVKKLMGVA